MKRRTIELLVAVMAVAAVSGAGTREVRIALHLKPELPIDGTENIFVGPILIEPREGENIQSVDLTAAREFEIYLRKDPDYVERVMKENDRPGLDPLHQPPRQPFRVAALPVAGNQTPAHDLVTGSAFVQDLDDFLVSHGSVLSGWR